MLSDDQIAAAIAGAGVAASGEMYESILIVVARAIEAEVRKSDEALIAEHAQALSFLCGLHTCLTIDGPPMAVAERIFDAVLAERTEMLDQIKRMERNLETMRQHKRTTP